MYLRVADLTVYMDSFGRVMEQAAPYQIEAVDTLDVIIQSEWEALKSKYPVLSDDDGVTWQHKLLLDERNEVSYPDAVEHNGFIYIIYDRVFYLVHFIG